MVELTAADIRAIVAALKESPYDAAEVVIGDVRIAVARNGVQLAPTGLAVPVVPTRPVNASPDEATPAVVPVEAPSGGVAATAYGPKAGAAPGRGDVQVSAPSVGVFWRAPEPGAPPFVEVGARVEKGDTIGIIEVMKLMAEIVADVAGVVTEILVANAQGVEYGTALVSIRPEDWTWSRFDSS